jgi:hypothetical protein
MKDIEDLLRMTERPQDYTDEELQQLMSDPDMRAYYELMVKAEEGFTQRNTKRDKARRLWKIAAMFVGIILLSGLTFAAVHIMRSQKTEVRSQETEAVTTSQPSTLNSQLPESDTIRTFENAELQQILSELADHYHLEVDYRNEQARHVRLYTKWNTAAPLSQIVERLNNFEKVNIRQTDNQIIAE